MFIAAFFFCFNLICYGGVCFPCLLLFACFVLLFVCYSFLCYSRVFCVCCCLLGLICYVLLLFVLFVVWVGAFVFVCV